MSLIYLFKKKKNTYDDMMHNIVSGTCRYL